MSHLFPLRGLRTEQTITILKSRDDGVDMRFRNSSDARNPNQGLCNVVKYCQISYIKVVEKKCWGGGEGLFSLLLCCSSGINQ